MICSLLPAGATLEICTIENGFRVPLMSVDDIRRAAERLRPILAPSGAPDLEDFVQSLEQFGIGYDVVEDDLLPPGVEASCLPERREIVISATTYDGADRPRSTGATAARNCAGPCDVARDAGNRNHSYFGMKVI